MRLRFFFSLALLATAILTGCKGPGDPVASLAVEPGQVDLGYPGFATLRLDWTLEEQPEDVDGSLRVFAHLVDEQGNLARTFDHDFPGDWRPGSSTSELNIYQSALAPPLAAGEYSLLVGLYDLSGRRWPLETAAEAAGELAYRVASVRVAESSGDSPMFFFASGWQPVEGGTDLQVLGRRWLTESGPLRLSEVTRSGSLWLLVGIPSGASKVEDLVLDEGAESPEVVITSDCSDELDRVTVSGSGSHGLELPVQASADGEPRECEIRFDSNFYLVSLETLARRTVALENLAWAAE